MAAWIGLILAFVSALVVNWAYTREQLAASTLPPLTPRRPIASARLLLRARAWLVGFGAETVGWGMYVGSLALAPIALVQAVGASGIVVLAAITARGPRQLGLHERVGVVVAVAGLALLGLSLVGEKPADHAPNGFATAVWLGACVGGAAFLASATFRSGRAAPLGLAAGLLFAGGDISAKLVVLGDEWVLAAIPLVISYGLGTLTLQSSFQHGDALTGAGLATLTTNALPIAAGFVLFGEALPGGGARVMQLAAFACIVLSATVFADPRARAAQSRHEGATELNRSAARREDVDVGAEYRFVDEWLVPMPIEQAYELLGDPLRYPEWWPEAFPQATGDPGPPKPGNCVDVVSKGFLPYRLRWTLTCVAVERPHTIDARMTGDFVGTSAWTLAETEDGGTRAVLDFRPAVAKPVVRTLSPLLRPLFRANHRWAMTRGQEAIRRLARGG